MPLHKYRRVEDMPPPPAPPEGPERIRRLRACWGAWARLLHPLDMRGLRRYRTLEEAKLDREATEARRVQRLARERGLGEPEG